MKRLALLVGVGWLLSVSNTAGQDTLPPKSNQEIYTKQKKTAQTLMIAGSAGMAAGMTMMVIGFNQAPLVTISWGEEPAPEPSHEGEGLMAAGGILFAGGTASLICGIVKNSKANKMKNEGLVYVRPTAPPVSIANANMQQQGITVGIRLNR